jgi:hypothetical protein
MWNVEAIRGAFFTRTEPDDWEVLATRVSGDTRRLARIYRGQGPTDDGMAPLPTRHEPAWAVGSGRGMEERQGAMTIFFGGGCVAPHRLRSAPEQATRTT